MTATDRTTAPDATFAPLLESWEAREADPDGTVERVAAAIANAAWSRPVDLSRERGVWQQHYRNLALAAIHALRPPAPQVDTEAAVNVHPADSDEPATAPERSALMIDALWTDDPYPEYSQGDVLRAYRIGYEDGHR